MPIKGTRWLITRRGAFAISVLMLVIEYLNQPMNHEGLKTDVVEVLDWIAGEVVKEAEG